MKNLFISLVLAHVAAFAVSLRSKILLISFDGFRWDYLDRVETPNFDKFVNEGVQAKHLNPTFITKTFPAHYTLVTGLYQESHGIVGNRMYDPVLNATFAMSNKDPIWWDNGGEPVWVTVSKQGGRSASYFWIGGETATNGGYDPDIWLKYNESHPYRARVDTVVRWFTEENIDFIALYFDEPDGYGHEQGYDSPETTEEIRKLDELLGYLAERFTEAGIYDSVNIIITADHGMAETPTSNNLDLYDYVDPGDVKLVTEFGPVMNILPVENKIMDVYNSLNGKHPNLTVYLKEDIPEHWHYRNNRRIQPILIVCDEGWEIFANLSSMSEFRLNLPGNHGYDNRLMSMKAIFVARGPGFKKNYKGDAIDGVDVYPLMCQLMGLQPAPNNGSLSNVLGMLLDSASSASLIRIRFDIVNLFVAAFAFVFMIALN
ncbi:ectonucleotide pyrophosphatase/phosphodiesterase family member 5-like [Ptychodera flava]|uniref:ectonucleotide pyrophosphatase/phosphodiesterase family member 5-like n=1 Tax=Ptychodera flava TaxID=63121 RepID=UPI003969EF0D